MRLFLAVEFDEAARRAIDGAARDLRAVLEGIDAAAARRVKWVDPRRLHLTLHFLGEVPHGVVSGLERVLRDSLPMKPFTVEFGGVGAFPAAGPLRVLWLGCTAGAADLRGLHRMLGDRLAGLPLTIAAGEVMPHVTLGRFREPGRPDLRSPLASVDAARVCACDVTSVALVESRLSPAGPSYAVRTRTGLLT